MAEVGSVLEEVEQSFKRRLESEAVAHDAAKRLPAIASPRMQATAAAIAPRQHNPPQRLRL
jgi:hypothetical protein